MKLDRNIPELKRGKYALIKLRDTTVRAESKTKALADGHLIMVSPHAVDFGDTPETDFFVIRLKDKYAAPALMAYARAAMEDGETEFAEEIREMARIAMKHPGKRKPD